MNQIRLPGVPELSLVNLGRENVSLLDDVEVWIGVVGGDPLEDVVQPNHETYPES